MRRDRTRTYSTTVLTTYQHDLARWIIGQTKTTSCTGTADCSPTKELSKTDFDANSLPWKVYSNGILQQTLTYDMSTVGAKGTLSSVKDGRNYTTTLANWKRGTPQSITFPTTPAVTQSAQVNNIGNIDWVIDELGSKTCYSYDAMGRMSAITYTSESAAGTCNTSTWASTSRAFVPVATPEYGLPAGHWKQVVQTGNGKSTTYYDGRWQPVLVLTEDTSNPASKSFLVSRFDSMGRKNFGSYAVGSLTSVGDAITGVRTTYDALGRTTQVQQDNGAAPGAGRVEHDHDIPNGVQDSGDQSARLCHDHQLSGVRRAEHRRARPDPASGGGNDHDQPSGRLGQAA